MSSAYSFYLSNTVNLEYLEISSFALSTHSSF